MEAFKYMSKQNLEGIRSTMNEWLSGDPLPEEALQAEVILIHKKGSTSDPSNYRPISLLNAVYKIYAAILQRRLEVVLDQHLQRSQYGFRKGRSTTQPLQAAKRLIS